MEIKTQRLKLREVNRKDLADIIEGLNNLNVSKWMLVFPFPYTKKDAKVYIARALKQQKENPRSSYGFAIELKENNKMIGGVNLSKIDFYQGKAMVSYWLNENYHQRGYGSEALEALLSLAFKKLKLRRLEAGVYPANPSSGKLLEKYGFKKEGYERESYRCKADGKIKDKICYGLLRSEYKLVRRKK